MSIALAALATLLGVQAGSPAQAVPITVKVELPAKAGPELSGWADELRTALGARKDEFRVVPAAARADVVVRLDAIEPAAEGVSTLKAALVRDGKARPFTYTFGDVKKDAEKLARNLRRLAEQAAAEDKK